MMINNYVGNIVLKEKINIFRCLSNSGGQDIELCHWFMAILLKMIRHDNRHIVKEGFLRFLSLGESQVSNLLVW